MVPEDLLGLSLPLDLLDLLILSLQLDLLVPEDLLGLLLPLDQLHPVHLWLLCHPLGLLDLVPLAHLSLQLGLLGLLHPAHLWLLCHPLDLLVPVGLALLSLLLVPEDLLGLLLLVLLLRQWLLLGLHNQQRQIRHRRCGLH